MKLFLAAALAGVAMAVSWEDKYVEDFDSLELQPIFEDWKAFFGKSYDSVEEEADRFLIWTDSWRYILQENAKGLNYTLKMNQFSDLTGDEFRLEVHGHKGSCLKRDDARPLLSALSANGLKRALRKKQAAAVLAAKRAAAPTSVDWTTKGVVTPVKNQGSCGSCWSFSATGSTECQYAIKTGTLNSLSEQELVDCSRAEGNEGCDGGLMDYAFEYIEKNDGLCSEEEYPYKGVDGICKASDCSTRYNPISTYTDVKTDDESDLMTAVASGCVSVAVEADQSSFQFYSGGVLDGRCGTSLDHGVLVVGYGSESGQDYWKVKNSWGESWGMDGYLLICRNCDKDDGAGECGILSEPSYPVV